jgi:hypothetical protein
MPSRPPPPAPSAHRALLLVLALCLAAACDRREEGVEGDLSPETGITTPTPQETPPSDPASGSGTPEPDAEAGQQPADERTR